MDGATLVTPEPSLASVHWIANGAAERRETAELGDLLRRSDGFLWVDIPSCDGEGQRILSEEFRFHPLAVQDCREQSRIPKIHVYPDHVFLGLHAPEPAQGGVIHLLELDLFIGPRYLVTVHEPRDGVGLDASLRETRAVLARIEGGRFRPSSTWELTYAVVSAVARRMESFVWVLADKVTALEQKAMKGHGAGSQDMLDEIFRLRHELLTLRTVASQCRELHARMMSLASRLARPEEKPYIEDLLDQFDRIRAMCDGEKEFLQGVLDFYQTRTATKMNLAMERIALLTAIVMPITAVASIYGMNIIVSEHTSLVHLTVVLIAMSTMAYGIFIWAKRKGWW